MWLRRGPTCRRVCQGTPCAHPLAWPTLAVDTPACRTNEYLVDDVDQVVKTTLQTCKRCPPGLFQSSIGATECEACPQGRHAENYGWNGGGMLFQDRDCSLSTGSFTLFAVLSLNDQTEVGRGQFSVLRGCHHAMEKFYQMQVDEGGIVGP